MASEEEEEEKDVYNSCWRGEKRREERKEISPLRS
jgi:hypothetical protein